MKLVIVESPSKSTTIAKYLGEEFKVMASIGHIRDLATSGAGGLGVDVENDFTPKYVVSKGKSKVVKQLKEAVSKANEVYLATDPDREGEAISWHLAQVLGLDIAKTKRVEFHEVTKRAVMEAFNDPRTINLDLVHSQETRRILDRIIGFKLSTLLNRKIKSPSAGRVQSVALKLIVEKEREIRSFNPEEYWNIFAEFMIEEQKLKLKYTKTNGKNRKLKNKEEADEVLNSLPPNFVISNLKVERKERNSKPAYTTSSLQQDASNNFKYNPKRTMSIAQKLYEGIELENERVGLITYMRTDSVRLSPLFISEAKEFINDSYGTDYIGAEKIDNSKKKNDDTKVQDAHEAIRPTDIKYSPEAVKPFLSKEEYNIYRMIWARTIASMMSAEINEVTSLEASANEHLFEAKGVVTVFDGFNKVYKEFDFDIKNSIPQLNLNQTLYDPIISPTQEFTRPPARYTEAKLIKTLEELGIGRPSTYATIVETIKARNYVELEKNTFIPTKQGEITTEKLDEFFVDIINTEYTAKMETNLDKVAEGEIQELDILKNFYGQFIELLTVANDKMEVYIETKGVCPKCGKDVVKRKGRFGYFFSCSGYPECDYIHKEATVIDEEAKPCPNCGKPLIKRKGRFGFFLGCSGYPECRYLENIKKEKKTPENTEEIKDAEI